MPRVVTKTRVLLSTGFRSETGLLLVLLALVVLSWLPRLRGPIDLRWDGGVYYTLGTSLAEGKGYRLLNEPGNIDATQYPPLLPAFVAAHQRILGTSDPLVVGRWLRLSYFLIFVIYITSIYFVAKSYLPFRYAFLATVVCLFNVQTYFLSDLCFPEIPFALATTLFVLCNKNNGRRIYPFLAALFAIAAYALRTAGIAVLAAWITESLFKKEWKRAAIRLAVSLLPVLSWQSYIHFIESGPRYSHPAYAYQRADYLYYNVSYAKNVLLQEPFLPELGYASFGDIAHRFLRNLTQMPASLAEAVSVKKTFWELPWLVLSKRLPFTLGAPWPVNVVLFMLGCLILGGVGLQLARRQGIIPLYILFSLAVVCLTPWPEQFNRYLAPLTPFLALSLFQSLLALREWSNKTLPARWKAAGLVFTASIPLLIFLQQSLAFLLVYTRWHQEVAYNDRNGRKIAYRLFFYHDSHRALDTALDWLKLQAKPGDIVASSMPHWVYLRTGLKAVMPPFEANPVKAQHLLDSVPVHYLILDLGLALDTRRYTSALAQNSPDRWKRVYSDSVLAETGEVLEDRFEIYRRVDPPTPLIPRQARTSQADPEERR